MIERADVQDCIEGESNVWETLNMTASCYNIAPLMMPLNSQEFLTLGPNEYYRDDRH